MGTAFRSEVLAIQKLRAKYPTMGQRALTDKIKARGFYNAEDNSTAYNSGPRTFYSIYSVVRRFDKQKSLAHA